MAGAATEPPLPPTFGCVEPTVATVVVPVAVYAIIAIATHKHEVLDNLKMFVVELVIVEVGRDGSECGENGRLDEVLILPAQPNEC